MLSSFRLGSHAVLVAGFLSLVSCGGGTTPPPPADDAGSIACVPGSQGCECASGRCGKSANGESLLCMGNVCEAMACPAGQSGCVCRGGTNCNDPGATCSNGFCVAPNCAPGTATCGCLAGSCDVGFNCLEDTVCVDSRGYEGGACLASGSCYRGSRCDAATSTCVYCSPGTPGCQCTAARGCNAGLVCAADICTAASALPPTHAACFTPCPASAAECPSDGLRYGCFDGQQCTQGSCLMPGELKPSCANDAQCPSFQVCLAGGCYSNCDVNADCPTGQGCFKHACRQTCSVASGQTNCPGRYACNSSDGITGFCTTTGNLAPGTSPNPTGGLRVPLRLLALSNVKASSEFVIASTSAITQDIVVRKKWHRVTYADQSVETIYAPEGDGGVYRACDPLANECPLWWLSVGTGPATDAGTTPMPQPATTSLRLFPNCVDTSNGEDAGAGLPCPKVQVRNAGGVDALRWEGQLEISSGQGGTETITLSYVKSPDGQWVGSMFYFGSFDTKNLDTPGTGWVTRTNKGDVTGVQNAFIRKWAELRAQSLDGWQEFAAVINATRDSSWDFGEVKAKCRALPGMSGDPRCYPYTNELGIRVYTDSLTAYPIPKGATSLPMGMNLRVAQGANQRFEGRVESSLAMHYPGNPELKLEFESDPGNAGSASTMSNGDRLLFLAGAQSVGPGVNVLTSTVGGRYVTADGTCPMGWAAAPIPWLVDGFTDLAQGTRGNLMRTECRDTSLPFDAASNGSFSKVNAALAGANPVPDGSARVRRLRFIDGALINQAQLFLLFEERYQSFIPGQPDTSAFGYIILKRAPATLDASSFVGRPVSTTQPQGARTLGAQCTDAVVRAALNSPTLVAANLTTAQMGDLVDKLINGSAGGGASPAGGFTQLNPTDTSNRIHYLCEDTGLFNGGTRDDGTPSAIKVACPAGSKVTYFNTGANRTSLQMAQEVCNTQTATDEDGNTKATCLTTLNGWVGTGTVVIENAPLYRCTNTLTGGTNNYCDSDRGDLRRGKTFFAKPNGSAVPVMQGLNALIDKGFRYKTRFRSSSGGTLGFAPRQCIPNSDSIPYCYDPSEIQEARERVDCLIDIYSRPGTITGVGGTQLDAANRTKLLNFLQSDFSRFPGAPSADGGVDPTSEQEGFERLYAELMIMQGDEALTSAYASRFDLAATGGSSFQGSKFETGGIDLTGVAGAELFQLYKATQYYQLALDRLYILGPNFGKALSLGSVGSANNFVSADTVTEYLERLVRAAAQKSRAWGEIARRYQNFNKPALARSVIERAYVGTYVESFLINSLMQQVSENSGPSYKDNIAFIIDKAQRTYRMALLDMRDVYAQLTDQLNYFGYPADYIPFPALDPGASVATSAFDSVLGLAKQRVDLAKQREQVALSNGKQGRVDAVQFQSDLVSIRNNYENQLAAACGTFIGADGQVYPAIKKYTAQSPRALLMGDPCGRMGNGDIHNAALAAQDNELKVKGVLLRRQNILQDIDTERKRVAAICGINVAQVDYTYNQATRSSSLQAEMANQRAETAFVASGVGAVVNGLQALSNASALSFAAVGAAAAITTAGLATAGAQFASDKRIAEKEEQLRSFDATSVKLAGNFQCNAGASNDGGFTGVLDDGGMGLGILQIESNARVASLLNDTFEVQIEALRADYALRGAAAEVERMYNNAQRVQAQYEEADQISIDLQQAQNDPNVRIYQNDSIINADVSFRDALATAYRLTRIYEYYTSQSYAPKEQLFLIRMVSAGFYNLENYLLQLENEFLNFEDQFGNPDIRVMVLSLRDDLSNIPLLDVNKHPRSDDDRIKDFQAKLKDPRLLDSRGYLTFPFSTSLKSLSPVTRNHKIHHLEVSLIGNSLGDPMARVYLRSTGTGIVRNVSGDIDYYVFPERLAVVNASIRGVAVYDAEVYRNYRFRDRPLVNTQWELVINRRDELVNQDIDLGTLSDVQIRVYYTDFTSF